MIRKYCDVCDREMDADSSFSAARPFNGDTVAFNAARKKRQSFGFSVWIRPAHHAPVDFGAETPHDICRLCIFDAVAGVDPRINTAANRFKIIRDSLIAIVDDGVESLDVRRVVGRILADCDRLAPR